MRKLVTYRRIRAIDDIPGADNIVLAKVDGWQCVVNKDSFNRNHIPQEAGGVSGFYFEIDSLLPMIPVFDFMKNRGTKKMFVDQKEVEGYKLRTIKLKNQLSQGLLLPLNAFENEPFFERLLEAVINDSDTDYADIIGVIKYEQPIPAQLQGLVKGNFPDFIAKTDQERVQNLTGEFPHMADSTFEVTEKLDGSSMTVYLHDGEFGVCSRNLDLKETEGNSFWRAARAMGLEERLRALKKDFAIQGELVGTGIQGNPYKLSGQKCFIYDVYDIANHRHLLPWERYAFLESVDLIGFHIPILEASYTCSGDLDPLLTLADGPSLLYPKTKREGIVLKSHLAVCTSGAAENTEPFHFKVVSNSYLLNEKDI